VGIRIIDNYKDEMSSFLAAIEDPVSNCFDGKQGLEVFRLIIDARRKSGLPCA
jgi:hypothetical protein